MKPNRRLVFFTLVLEMVIIGILIVVVGCTEQTPTPTQSPLPSPLVTPQADAGALVVEKSNQMEETNTMNVTLQWLLDFCMGASLQIIVGLCAIDLGVGVGAALKAKAFDWKKVGDFYTSQILALLVPYVVVLAVLAFVPTLTEWLPVAVAPAGMLAGIVAKLGGSIIANAQKLGLGGSE